mgnify:FL=1
MNLNSEKLEHILLGATIIICITVFFWPDPEIVEYVPPKVSMDEEPIQAWKDTHKKWNDEIGDIVKIKYKIDKKNVTIWIHDSNTGKLVHKQPFDMDPYPDDYNKPDRVHTYIWRLYKSEWSEYIPPGDYMICVGAFRESTNNYYLEITI